MQRFESARRLHLPERTISRRRLVGLAVAVAVVTTACAATPGTPNGCGGSVGGPSPACSHAPSAPPGGLSQDAAIAAARKVASQASGALTVVWAGTSEVSPFGAPNAGDSWVWEVRLQGPLEASPCPSGFLEVVPTPSDPACLDQDSGLVAVLDYYSGALLGWTH